VVIGNGPFNTGEGYPNQRLAYPQGVRYCIDVPTQISAVQAALDKVALGLLDDHARHCLVGGEPAEMTDELMAAVGRLMSRG
jgi:hypothetical protein